MNWTMITLGFAAACFLAAVVVAVASQYFPVVAWVQYLPEPISLVAGGLLLASFAALHESTCMAVMGKTRSMLHAITASPRKVPG